MARQLVGAALLSLIVAACSSSPLDPSFEQGATETEPGSVNLPLMTKTSDAAYRLSKAAFTITGETLTAPRVVKPLPDVEVHNEKLPIGSYSIFLAKGWVLEKMPAGAAAWTVVPADLVTANPLLFDVNGKTPADAFFGFVTAGGDVALGDGSVNIRIGVQDCQLYDVYMASLGELTARCLGTVDPRAYDISADGFLTPNFTSCTAGDRTLIRSIRQLLSLQHRTARLPFAKSCMANRYSQYLQKFAGSGIEVCPIWKKDRVVNPIDEGVIAKLEGLLPELPAKDGPLLPDVMEGLKENSIYSVGFEQEPPKQNCATPAECGMICAGAFPGFTVGGKPLTETSIMTDPPAWQLETVYDEAGLDPYLRVNYYHPMSYYNGTPGVLFGAYERFDPCGLGECIPETCSFFSGLHLKTKLQKDCLNDSDLDTCVSYCGPPLP